MPLKRFGDEGEAFHFSMLASYISFCGLATKFRYVYGLAEEYRSVKMWKGTVLHKAIEIIHKKDLLDADETALTELIQDCMRYAEYEKDIETPIFWDDRETEKAEFLDECLLILTNYCKAPFNRDCEILLNEAEFELALVTPKTVYPIQGKLDQLRRWPDNSLEIIDFKYSVMPAPSDIQLARDVQLNGYPIAVVRGTFTENGEKKQIGELPSSITYYNLKDHLEYVKPTPVATLDNRSNNLSSSYKEWFTEVAKTYSLDEIREITGNSKLRATDKVYFNTGHQKGPGLHTIPLTAHRATIMEKAIKWACASMRLNMYLPNKAACSSCRVQETCNYYMDGLDDRFEEETT